MGATQPDDLGQTASMSTRRITPVGDSTGLTIDARALRVEFGVDPEDLHGEAVRVRISEEGVLIADLSGVLD